MSWTQRGGSLAPPLHRTSTSFFFLLLPFPRSLIAVLIYLKPSGGSVPPPANCCWRTTMFITSAGTMIPPSAVSYITRIPSPSVPPSHPKPTTVASSPPHAGISLKLVRTIEGLMCDKYVTLGSPGVVLITLLQDYYAVPRLSVIKVYHWDCL